MAFLVKIKKVGQRLTWLQYVFFDGGVFLNPLFLLTLATLLLIVWSETLIWKCNSVVQTQSVHFCHFTSNTLILFSIFIVRYSCDSYHYGCVFMKIFFCQQLYLNELTVTSFQERSLF